MALFGLQINSQIIYCVISMKTQRHLLSFCNRGPLLTRNLGDLVKKENFILDSEYLTTLLVKVPW